MGIQYTILRVTTSERSGFEPAFVPTMNRLCSLKICRNNLKYHDESDAKNHGWIWLKYEKSYENLIIDLNVTDESEKNIKIMDESDTNKETNHWRIWQQMKTHRWIWYK